MTIASFVLSNVLDSWNQWFPSFDEKAYTRKQVSFQLMCTSRLRRLVGTCHHHGRVVVFGDDRLGSHGCVAVFGNDRLGSVLHI